MKFFQLLIILTTLLLATFASPVLSPTEDILPGELCIPHADGQTCTLFYRTNSGQTADLSNPSSLLVYGNATIYSPGCRAWGSTTKALTGNVKILAWGLDIKNPLVLNVEYVGGAEWGFSVPVWTYEGKTWHGTSYCFCMPGPGKGEHTCNCPFLCESASVIG